MFVTKKNLSVWKIVRVLVGVFSIFHFCSADRCEKKLLYLQFGHNIFPALFPDKPSAQYKTMTSVGLNKLEVLFASTFFFFSFFLQCGFFYPAEWKQMQWSACEMLEEAYMQLRPLAYSMYWNTDITVENSQISLHPLWIQQLYYSWQFRQVCYE